MGGRHAKDSPPTVVQCLSKYLGGLMMILRLLKTETAASSRSWFGYVLPTLLDGYPPEPGVLISVGALQP